MYISILFGVRIGFGGGNDAEMYNLHALGYITINTTYWPIFLRWLNSIGFYSRDGVVAAYQLLTLIIIPLFACLIVHSGQRLTLKVGLFVFFIFSFYPTLFMFSYDVARDVAMFFLFILGIYSAQKFLYGNFIFLFSVILFSFLLFNFRGYLGFSFVCSFLFFPLLKKINNPKVFLLFYILILTIIRSSGYMDPLLDYRGDGWDSGGSSLGLDMINTSAITFPIVFILSYLAQVFGFFIPNLSSLIVFLTESVPFLICFYYVIVNIRFSDSFCYYLITFFLIYNSIWVIANDNLGTACRIRIYSYAAIYIAAGIIYLKKKNIAIA